MTEPARENEDTVQTNETRKSDPFIGQVFNGRFRVKSLIARGGLGAVYLAEQAPLGRKCAIKILRPRYEGATQDEFHKRFFLEASIASKLSHPNNVTLFDYGHTDDGTYFMAMEYLEGRTLAKAIRQDGAFTEERAVHITRQICRALREAHSLGVIHRDIKPGNIFLTHFHDQEDFVKVLDFGLVKHVENPEGEDLTQAGVFMGSPKYMAPEQVQGDEMDARTDIYALGIVMYEMLTGKVPFNESTSVKTLIAHVNQPPPPMREVNPDIQISPTVEQVVYKCIQKRKEDRFASVDELLTVLKTVEGGALTATMSSTGVSGTFSSTSNSGLFPAAGTDTGSGLMMAPNASQSTSQAMVADGLGVPGKKSKVPVVIGAVAALVLVGVVAFFIGGGGNGNESNTGSTPSVATNSAIPVVPSTTATSTNATSAQPSQTASAPKPEKVMVHLSTKPDKARVFIGSAHGKVVCELTPCDVDRAELPDDVRLYFVKRGYVAVKKKLGKDAKKLELTLVRVPRHGGGAKKPPTNPAPTGINAYKQDPY